MKKKITKSLVVLLTFVFIFSIPCAALEIPEYRVTLSVPEGFTVLNDKNIKEHQDFLSSTGYTATAFKNYLSKHNMILFAADDGNQHQITLSCFDSNFSKELGDLSLISDENLPTVVLALISDKVVEYSKLTVNGIKWIGIQSLLSGAGGNHCSAQYITVKNNKVYTLTYTATGTELNSSDELLIQNLLGELEISKEPEKITLDSVMDIATIVILVLLILFLLGVAISIFYSLMIDIYRKYSTNDVADYVRIKRRRFK